MTVGIALEAGLGSANMAVDTADQAMLSAKRSGAGMAVA